MATPATPVGGPDKYKIVEDFYEIRPERFDNFLANITIHFKNIVTILSEKIYYKFEISNNVIQPGILDYSANRPTGDGWYTMKGFLDTLNKPDRTKGPDEFYNYNIAEYFQNLNSGYNAYRGIIETEIGEIKKYIIGCRIKNSDPDADNLVQEYIVNFIVKPLIGETGEPKDTEIVYSYFRDTQCIKGTITSVAGNYSLIRVADDSIFGTLFKGKNVGTVLKKLNIDRERVVVYKHTLDSTYNYFIFRDMYETLNIAAQCKSADEDVKKFIDMLNSVFASGFGKEDIFKLYFMKKIRDDLIRKYIITGATGNTFNVIDSITGDTLPGSNYTFDTKFKFGNLSPGHDIPDIKTITQAIYKICEVFSNEYRETLFSFSDREIESVDDSLRAAIKGLYTKLGFEQFSSEIDNITIRNSLNFLNFSDFQEIKIATTKESTGVIKAGFNWIKSWFVYNPYVPQSALEQINNQSNKLYFYRIIDDIIDKQHAKLVKTYHAFITDIKFDSKPEKYKYFNTILRNDNIEFSAMLNANSKKYNEKFDEADISSSTAGEKFEKKSAELYLTENDYEKPLSKYFLNILKYTSIDLHRQVQIFPSNTKVIIEVDKLTNIDIVRQYLEIAYQSPTVIHLYITNEFIAKIAELGVTNYQIQWEKKEEWEKTPIVVRKHFTVSDIIAFIIARNIVNGNTGSKGFSKELNYNLLNSIPVSNYALDIIFQNIISLEKLKGLGIDFNAALTPAKAAETPGTAPATSAATTAPSTSDKDKIINNLKLFRCTNSNTIAHVYFKKNMLDTEDKIKNFIKSFSDIVDQPDRYGIRSYFYIQKETLRQLDIFTTRFIIEDGKMPWFFLSEDDEIPFAIDKYSTLFTGWATQAYTTFFIKIANKLNIFEPGAPPKPELVATAEGFPKMEKLTTYSKNPQKLDVYYNTKILDEDADFSVKNPEAHHTAMTYSIYRTYIRIKSYINQNKLKILNPEERTSTYNYISREMKKLHYKVMVLAILDRGLINRPMILSEIGDEKATTLYPSHMLIKIIGKVRKFYSEKKLTMDNVNNVFIANPTFMDRDVIRVFNYLFMYSAQSRPFIFWEAGIKEDDFKNKSVPTVTSTTPDDEMGKELGYYKPREMDLFNKFIALFTNPSAPDAVVSPHKIVGTFARPTSYTDKIRNLITKNLNASYERLMEGMSVREDDKGVCYYTTSMMKLFFFKERNFTFAMDYCLNCLYHGEDALSNSTKAITERVLNFMGDSSIMVDAETLNSINRGLHEYQYYLTTSYNPESITSIYKQITDYNSRINEISAKINRADARLNRLAMSVNLKETQKIINSKTYYLDFMAQLTAKTSSVLDKETAVTKALIAKYTAETDRDKVELSSMMTVYDELIRKMNERAQMVNDMNESFNKILEYLYTNNTSLHFASCFYKKDTAFHYSIKREEYEIVNLLLNMDIQTGEIDCTTNDPGLANIIAKVNSILNDTMEGSINFMDLRGRSTSILSNTFQKKLMDYNIVNRITQEENTKFNAIYVKIIDQILESNLDSPPTITSSGIIFKKGTVIPTENLIYFADQTFINTLQTYTTNLFLKLTNVKNKLQEVIKILQLNAVIFTRVNDSIEPGQRGTLENLKSGMFSDIKTIKLNWSGIMNILRIISGLDMINTEKGSLQCLTRLVNQINNSGKMKTTGMVNILRVPNRDAFYPMDLLYKNRLRKSGITFKKHDQINMLISEFKRKRAYFSFYGMTALTNDATVKDMYKNYMNSGVFTEEEYADVKETAYYIDDDGRDSLMMAVFNHLPETFNMLSTDFGFEINDVIQKMDYKGNTMMHFLFKKEYEADEVDDTVAQNVQLLFWRLYSIMGANDVINFKNEKGHHFLHNLMNLAKFKRNAYIEQILNALALCIEYPDSSITRNMLVYEDYMLKYVNLNKKDAVEITNVLQKIDETADKVSKLVIARKMKSILEIEERNGRVGVLSPDPPNNLASAKVYYELRNNIYKQCMERYVAELETMISKQSKEDMRSYLNELKRTSEPLMDPKEIEFRVNIRRSDYEALLIEYRYRLKMWGKISIMNFQRGIDLDINVIDNDGNTPLMMNVENNTSEFLNNFINILKPDKRIKNKNGDRVYDLYTRELESIYHKIETRLRFSDNPEDGWFDKIKQDSEYKERVALIGALLGKDILEYALENLRRDVGYTDANAITLDSIKMGFDYNTYIFRIDGVTDSALRYRTMKCVNLPGGTVLWGSEDTLTYSMAMFGDVPYKLAERRGFIFIDDPFYRYFIYEPIKIAADQYYTRTDLLRKSYNIPLDLLYIMGAVGFIDYGVQNIARSKQGIFKEKQVSDVEMMAMPIDIGDKGLWDRITDSPFLYQILGTYATSKKDPVSGMVQEGFLRVIDLGDSFIPLSTVTEIRVKYNASTGFLQQVSDNYEIDAYDYFNTVVTRSGIQKSITNIKQGLDEYETQNYIFDKGISDYLLTIFIHGETDTAKLKDKRYFLIDEDRYECKTDIIINDIDRYYVIADDLLEKIMRSNYILYNNKQKIIDSLSNPLSLTIHRSGEKYWKGYGDKFEFLLALRRVAVNMGNFGKIRGINKIMLRGQYIPYSATNPTLFGSIIEQENSRIRSIKMEMAGWANIDGINSETWTKLNREISPDSKYWDANELDTMILMNDVAGFFAISVAARSIRQMEMRRLGMSIGREKPKKAEVPTVLPNGGGFLNTILKYTGLSMLYSNAVDAAEESIDTMKKTAVTVEKTVNLYAEIVNTGNEHTLYAKKLLKEVNDNKPKFDKFVKEYVPELVGNTRAVTQIFNIHGYIDQMLRYYRVKVSTDMLKLINNRDNIATIEDENLRLIGFTDENIRQMRDESLGDEEKMRIIMNNDYFPRFNEEERKEFENSAPKNKLEMIQKKIPAIPESFIIKNFNKQRGKAVQDVAVANIIDVGLKEGTVRRGGGGPTDETGRSISPSRKIHSPFNRTRKSSGNLSTSRPTTPVRSL